ncbi:MAG: hypothetical protein KDA66_17990, partial [Planctomycetaceae bacterium]|nr:hypothetical protein [Planctomycetaceae bacterium]
DTSPRSRKSWKNCEKVDLVDAKPHGFAGPGSAEPSIRALRLGPLANPVGCRDTSLRSNFGGFGTLA